jgi:spermidine synthase
MAAKTMRTVLYLTLKRRPWNRETLDSSRSLRHACRLHTGNSSKQAHSVTASQAHAPYRPQNAIEDIYDVVIVGGGVAGTARACSLGW